MQGFITATSRDGNKLSCVLKVSLLLYCLIPGKSNWDLLLLAFFFSKVLVGLWKMSWFRLKVRQPTKHGKSTAQIQSLTTFIALNSLSLLHWPLRSKWISHSIKQQSRAQFSPPPKSYKVIGATTFSQGIRVKWWRHVLVLSWEGGAESWDAESYDEGHIPSCHGAETRYPKYWPLLSP